MDMPQEAAPQEQPAQLNPADGYEICVTCLPDGTFNVSAEPLDPQEEQSETSPGMPAKSFDEALAAAQQIYSQMAGEQQEQPGAPEGGQEDEGESFEQGFADVRGAGLGR